MKKLLAAAAIIVTAAVAGGAGWWFLIREDNSLATNAPEIPQDLVQATASPASNATQPSSAAGVLTFRINADRSQAAYFVNEELASVGLPSTAKGVTNDIEGEF